MVKSGFLQSVTLAFLLMTSAGFPGLEAAETVSPIKLMAITELKAGSHGHYVVKARINKSDIEVLVDTGASVVALSYEDAQTTGLRPNTLVFDVPVSTANGNVMAARATLDRVDIDSVRVDNVAALVLPVGALKGTLLGMSFLSKLDSFKAEDGVLTLRN